MNTKESFIIQGLAGEKKLQGEVRINGAKNAALKAMAASVLFDGPVMLQNIPDTEDVKTMGEVLERLGSKVSWSGEALGKASLVIDSSAVSHTVIDRELAKTMRASVVLTGPMLARFGKVSFPAPGGCVIGARPIDLFIDGYAKMGANTAEENCTYNIAVTRTEDARLGKLEGTNIVFNKISVGATETLMMAAVLASGTTTLENCAMEPEIGNVAEWLNACGAKISGYGTPKMTIEGSNGVLLSPRAPYVAIPDRVEAGSYLLLGALCAKDLTIKDCRPDHLETLISLLKKSGVPIETDAHTIKIVNNTKPNSSFKSFDIETREYPGFPTDLQAQAVAFLTQVTGQSAVKETIFEGRFKYVSDLVKMGASIEEVNPHQIMVKGPTPLHALLPGEGLSAHDIRAGFAVVMAALTADGEFKISNVHLIDRGYEKLEERLRNLGANIERVGSSILTTEKVATAGVLVK